VLSATDLSITGMEHCPCTRPGHGQRAGSRQDCRSPHQPRLCRLPQGSGLVVPQTQADSHHP
jgi:hypothetical protein